MQARTWCSLWVYVTLTPTTWKPRAKSSGWYFPIAASLPMTVLSLPVSGTTDAIEQSKVRVSSFAEQDDKTDHHLVAWEEMSLSYCNPSGLVKRKAVWSWTRYLQNHADFLTKWEMTVNAVCKTKSSCLKMHTDERIDHAISKTPKLCWVLLHGLEVFGDIGDELSLQLWRSMLSS